MAAGEVAAVIALPHILFCVPAAVAVHLLVVVVDSTRSNLTAMGTLGLPMDGGTHSSCPAIIAGDRVSTVVNVSGGDMDIALGTTASLLDGDTLTNRASLVAAPILLYLHRSKSIDLLFEVFPLFLSAEMEQRKCRGIRGAWEKVKHTNIEVNRI